MRTERRNNETGEDKKKEKIRLRSEKINENKKQGTMEEEKLNVIVKGE